VLVKYWWNRPLSKYYVRSDDGHLKLLSVKSRELCWHLTFFNYTSQVPLTLNVSSKSIKNIAISHSMSHYFATIRLLLFAQRSSSASESLRLCVNGCQFHQRSMSTLYVCRSQKRKKMTSWLSFLRFWDLHA